jgi:hypothetical protein
MECATSSGASDVESAATGERGVSTQLDNCQLRSVSPLAHLTLLAGIATALFAAALTVRSYMPCPYWDQWTFIADIARGARPSSWQWLWSQHNEHRLVITRLLVWGDFAFFGARGISLFVEMYVIQILQWAVIVYALERLAGFPQSLKRTIEGLFAFCMFHPNQMENLTWAFQVSFVLCFAIGTVALIAVAYFEQIPARWRGSALVALALSPLAASMNLSAGLLMAPILLGLACVKRLPWKTLAMLASAYSLSFLAYLHGYNSPAGSSPISSISQPKSLLLYVLTYLDASWRLILPGQYRLASTLSLIVLFALLVQVLRSRTCVTNFELFCLAECSFVLITAFATAAGRLHFGVEQALSSRYQTPAMLYWAAFFSLIFIALWRKDPSRLRAIEAAVVVLTLCSFSLFPFYWNLWAKNADRYRDACAVVTGPHYTASAAAVIGESSQEVHQGVALLHRTWRH